MNFENLPCAYCGTLVRRQHSQLKRSKTGNIFCSKSCSATHNNSTFPKRKLAVSCRVCAKPIRSPYTYCKSCFNDTLTENKTYAELAGKVRYQKNSAVRSHARKKYLNSNFPKCCIICGYSKHIDICHLKDISSFPGEAKILEINDFKNLVAMCKNHHWEFDQGIMSPEDLEIIYNYIKQGIEDSNL